MASCSCLPLALLCKSDAPNTRARVRQTKTLLFLSNVEHRLTYESNARLIEVLARICAPIRGELISMPSRHNDDRKTSAKQQNLTFPVAYISPRSFDNQMRDCAEQSGMLILQMKFRSEGGFVFGRNVAVKRASRDLPDCSPLSARQSSFPFAGYCYSVDNLSLADRQRPRTQAYRLGICARSCRSIAPLKQFEEPTGSVPRIHA